MEFFRAQLSTSHFEFEAYGETEEKAVEAMLEGFRWHCRDYSTADLDEMIEFYREDIAVLKVKIGGAYRDRWESLGPRSTVAAD